MEDNFYKPHTLEEALLMLKNGHLKVVAGGTDLIVNFRETGSIEKNILDISTIYELKKICLTGSSINIGACATHAEIEKNTIVKENVAILAKGCSLVGSTLIRNRGTIGGNIVNNSNCADSIPPLMILDGELVIQSLGEKRIVPLKDFFLAGGKVQLKEDEIVTSIMVRPLNGYKWNIIKVGRRKSLAVSRLTLAAAMKIKDRLIEDIRICSGAVLPKPQRFHDVEKEFIGADLSEMVFYEIGKKVSEKVLSITGTRWSSEYKIPVLKELIARTLIDLTEEEMR